MDITGNEIPSQNVAGREPTLDLHVKNNGPDLVGNAVTRTRVSARVPTERRRTGFEAAAGILFFHCHHHPAPQYGHSSG